MCDPGLTILLYYWAPSVPIAQYKIMSTLIHTFGDIPLKRGLPSLSTFLIVKTTLWGCGGHRDL